MGLIGPQLGAWRRAAWRTGCVANPVQRGAIEVDNRQMASTTMLKRMKAAAAK
jgi:hypothetical protein